MKIADKQTMIISFLNTILSDKEDKYYLLSPELNGSVKIDIGSGKKKYQCINGDLCIPHSFIKDEYKQNIDVIRKSSFLNYALIKKDYIQEDKISKYITETENDLHEFYENNPKVKSALEDLLQALKEAKY